MSAALADVSVSAVAGYVEAVTANAVLGWVWAPGRAETLGVELRLGAEVVARSVADELREDLARNGIGDGRHAFTLAVPEEARGRLSELRVFALDLGGGAVALGQPPAEDGVGERLAHLHRGMEMLVGSQRVLHRNLQAALLARGEDGAAVSEIAAAQAGLKEGIATLELFVMRLEEKLSALASRPEPKAGPRWALGGVAAVAVAALGVSVWALIRVMPG